MNNVIDVKINSQGISSEGLLYIEAELIYENNSKTVDSYSIYCTSRGISEDTLSIKNFKIQFINPYTSNPMFVKYNENLFNEIHDFCFDIFFIMLDDVKLSDNKLLG